MKKIAFLVMSLSVLAFTSCGDDDKDSPSNQGGNSGVVTGGTGDSTSKDFVSSGTENGYDYVDLGLSSGTLWATCNVGAAIPQGYGSYYAWGETSPKTGYTWATYKYGNDSLAITKYCVDAAHGKDGFTDNLKTLELEDDAAYVNWGGNWRMPTSAQRQEIIDECYWVYTDSYKKSMVSGYIVYKAKASADKGTVIPKGLTPSDAYSLADEHIFLPMAGARLGGGLSKAGIACTYACSSLYTSNSSRLRHITIESEGVRSTQGYRYCGHVVRPVCHK